MEHHSAQQIGRPEAVSASPDENCSDATHTNAVIGDYECLNLLGQGGMGTVWRARHRTLGRIVALKLVRPDRLQDCDAVARFNREIAALGRLAAHPNVVLATDARCIDDQQILVMEYCEGHDLSHIVKSCGPLSVEDACEIARQIALGLAHIAAHRLVHRDLKPSNVLLTADGVARILDLGLARMMPLTMELLTELTHEGQAMGTPDFMAPEQWRDSRSVDIRTDLYSLGCTLHYLLAGMAPFRVSSSDSPLFKQNAHLYAPIPLLHPIRTDVPDDVQDLICVLMSKSVDERPADADSIALRLDRWSRNSDLRQLMQRMEPFSPAPQPPPTPSVAFADTVLENCGTCELDTADPDGDESETSHPATCGLRLQVSGTPFIYSAPSNLSTVTVGRQRRRSGGTLLEGCDLVIRFAADDDRVLRISRQHFRVRFHADQMLLSDLSKTGTRVNGRRLKPGENVCLHAGDRIQIADLVELCVLPNQILLPLVEVQGPVVCEPYRDGRPVMLEISVGDLKTTEPTNDDV